MQYPILMIFVVLWLVIGLPLAKLSQQAKKNNAAKNAAQKKAPEPAPESPKPAPAPEPLYRETRLTPSISVTEHDDSIYHGSLNAVTGEGYDPCHDEQMAPLTLAESAVSAPAEEVPGIQLGWTGNDIVRGLVMSEILNRRKGRVS